MKKDKNGNTGSDNAGENNSGNGNSGDWNSGYGNSGYGNSGYGNSGDRNSGDWNSGYGNSGNRNSGYGNSGYGNSGNRNSGYGNSGNGNSGYGNSGNGNSGVFCSDEPVARFFNKPTDIKFSEFLQTDSWPDFSGMSPCVWVESAIMTAEEKKANPTHETTGGYIKELSYKDAWAVWWRTTSETNKRKTMALPNFDTSIFREITGIDVDGNSENKKKAAELRKKAEEMLKAATDLDNSL